MVRAKRKNSFELVLGMIIGGCFTLSTMIYLEEGTSDVFSFWVWVTIFFVGIALVSWVFTLFTNMATDNSRYDDDVPDFTTQISPEKRRFDDDW